MNANDLITAKFAWGRGYGALSVSHSNVDFVARYIADQEEHHRVKTFTDELRESSSIVTGWVGTMKEAVETVHDALGV